ncbi:MAG: hypothetical protein L6R41_007223 [Letrouitia leprolyta]|nr:MAG: hypothetical protein L6R41_007223 [Letrouitia leprolyta]
MPFELAEIQVTDLPELAKLANKVWQAKSWELERHLYPVFDTEIMYPYRLKRITQGFQGDFKKHFKIVDTSNGRIVSYAAWEIPHPPQSEEASSQGGVPNNSPELSLPAGSNVQLFKDFYEELKRCKAKYSDQSRDYYLRAMLTDPEYQGQGLASILLRKFMEGIDAEGRRCYLEASPGGYPIYLHFGWKVVDEIKLDLEKYGIDEPWVDTTACKIMIREAATT